MGGVRRSWRGLRRRRCLICGNLHDFTWLNKIFCERLTGRLRSSVHTVAGTEAALTASVGLATHAPEKPLQRASHLIEAAERSAGVAKKAGRDRLLRRPLGGPVSAKA